jgi:hypothetical protein
MLMPCSLFEIDGQLVPLVAAVNRLPVYVDLTSHDIAVKVIAPVLKFEIEGRLRDGCFVGMYTPLSFTTLYYPDKEDTGLMAVTSRFGYHKREGK